MIEGVDGRPIEREKTFDEQEIGGGEALLAGLAGVGGKVVHRDFDAAASGELAEVSGEALVVEGLGRVEVDAASVGWVEGGQVAVVRVEGEHGGWAGQVGLEGAGERGLARTGGTGQADEAGRPFSVGVGLHS